MLKAGILTLAVAACSLCAAAVAAAPSERPEKVVPVGARGRANNAPVAPLAEPVEKSAQQLAEEGMRLFSGSADGVLALAFSPDGKMLASACGDRSVTLWDVQTGKPLKRWVGHASIASAVSFSPDGKRLVSGGYDSVLNTWDIARERIDFQHREDGPARHVKFLKNSRYIASSYGTHLHIFDDQVGTKRTCFHDATIGDFAIGPNDEVITADHAGTLTIWNPLTGRKIAQYARPTATRWHANDEGPNFLMGVAALPNGNVMLSDVTGFWVLDRATEKFELIGKNLYHLTGPMGDGSIYGGGESTNALWFRERSRDGVGLRMVLPFKIHAMAISPDGQWVAVSGGGEWTAQSQWRTAGPMDIRLMKVESIRAGLDAEKRVKLRFLEFNLKTDPNAVLDQTAINRGDERALPWKKVDLTARPAPAPEVDDH